MRKFLLLAVIFGISGCHQQKNEITRLSSYKDSMSVATAEKDSAILDFLMTFNEIQANLDSIKKLEQIVTVARDEQGELKGSRKQQIVEDLAPLHAKKARIISVHPLGSYRISGTKSADTLYI